MFAELGPAGLIIIGFIALVVIITGIYFATCLYCYVVRKSPRFFAPFTHKTREDAQKPAE